LQLFLPLALPQPPLPAQEFFFAQQCFSIVVGVFESSAGLGDAVATTVVPTTNPVSAAPIKSFFTDFVIITSSPLSSVSAPDEGWRVGGLEKPAFLASFRQPQQN
jgi:hypothetical protein